LTWRASRFFVSLIEEIAHVQEIGCPIDYRCIRFADVGKHFRCEANRRS